MKSSFSLELVSAAAARTVSPSTSVSHSRSASMPWVRSLEALDVKN